MHIQEKVEGLLVPLPPQVLDIVVQLQLLEQQHVLILGLYLILAECKVGLTRRKLGHLTVCSRLLRRNVLE